MRLFGAVAVAAALLGSGAAAGDAQTLARKPVHLGVASCAGGNCHGAVLPAKGSSVRQDEYLIWWQESNPARVDKHHRAYTVLLGKRARRIARNLGLADAATAPLCLNCHADNVPPDRRGPLFRLADGVGCEACHGGAGPSGPSRAGWLGVHLSGAGHQANLDAGLRRTEDPAERAKLCLRCHFGDPADDQRFVTHRIMGAGHPRMPFELDTFTLAEPAHFVVTKRYLARKGPLSDARVWAVGQAASLVARMDALMSPKRAPKGVIPELALFDCEACHHDVTVLRWRNRASNVLGPGRPRLYDANAVMLEVIAARLAPDLARQLRAHVLALHRATTENWDAVVREAAILRGLAQSLETTLARADFSRADLSALAHGLLAAGRDGEANAYSGAEQATMGLGAIAANMQMAGLLGAAQVQRLNAALAGLDGILADYEAYRPDAFVKALDAVHRALPVER